MICNETRISPAIRFIPSEEDNRKEPLINRPGTRDQEPGTRDPGPRTQGPYPTFERVKKKNMSEKKKRATNAFNGVKG